MAEGAVFAFSPDTIGHVLADRVLAVPIYQRSYSWKMSQIEEFWTDLQGAFKDDKAEYFIGNLVFSKEGAENGVLSIIDGQQRLATTLMLLAAVRESYYTRGDEVVALHIQSSFI